jgi:hypothetical protein
VIVEHPTSGIGLGKNGKPFLFLSERGLSATVHSAFASAERTLVDAFHREGLAAGGNDNGPPGLRSQYHATYYGAFVLDPDR